MQVAALLPSQVSSFSVGVGRYKAKPLREPAVQATAYSPSGSTSSSPLVSYSTTSYFPARAPVSRTPSTASDVEPRGASASSSSFGDAASGASASESSFILTADPPLSRAQGGKNSSMRPRDTGVHAQQEPRRRPAKSTVMVARNPAFRQKAPGIRGGVWGESPRFFYFFFIFSL